METEKTNGTQRKALGRGLKDLMGASYPDTDDPVAEHVQAARIGAAILELMDQVDRRYQPVIFHSVDAYRRAANRDEVNPWTQESIEAGKRSKPRRRMFGFLPARNSQQ